MLSNKVPFDKCQKDTYTEKYFCLSCLHKSFRPQPRLMHLHFFKSHKPIISGLLSFVIAFWGFHFVLGLAHAQTAVSAQLLFAPTTITIVQGNTFTVAVGLDSPLTVYATDMVLNYDSTLLDAVTVTLGNSNLKSFVPSVQSSFDVAKAVTIGPDPTHALLSFGLIAFDEINNTPTSGIVGHVDPASAPLAVITFKAKKSGNTTVTVKYDGQGHTTDANVVVQNPSVQDILGPPQQQINVHISSAAPIFTSPSPTPTIFPTPTSFPIPSTLPASPSTSPTPILAVSPSPEVTPLASLLPAPTSTPIATPTSTSSPSTASFPSADPTATPTPEISPTPGSILPTPLPSSSPIPLDEGLATLTLTGDQTAEVGDKIDVALGLQTEQPVIGVDAIIKFDPRRLAAYEVTDLHVLPQTTNPNINNGNGTITTSHTTLSGRSFNEERDLAVIHLKALAAGETHIGFDYQAGSETDSNIVAVGGSDILAQPGSLALTIKEKAKRDQAQTTNTAVTVNSVSSSPTPAASPKASEIPNSELAISRNLNSPSPQSISPASERMDVTSPLSNETGTLAIQNNVLGDSRAIVPTKTTISATVVGDYIRYGVPLLLIFVGLFLLAWLSVP